MALGGAIRIVSKLPLETRSRTCGDHGDRAHSLSVNSIPRLETKPQTIGDRPFFGFAWRVTRHCQGGGKFRYLRENS